MFVLPRLHQGTFATALGVDDDGRVVLEARLEDGAIGRFERLFPEVRVEAA